MGDRFFFGRPRLRCKTGGSGSASASASVAFVSGSVTSASASASISASASAASSDPRSSIFTRAVPSVSPISTDARRAARAAFSAKATTFFAICLPSIRFDVRVGAIGSDGCGRAAEAGPVTPANLCFCGDSIGPLGPLFDVPSSSPFSIKRRNSIYVPSDIFFTRDYDKRREVSSRDNRRIEQKLGWQGEGNPQIKWQEQGNRPTMPKPDAPKT